MRWVAAVALAALAAALPVSAWAHEADMIFVNVERGPERVRQRITLTAQSLLLLAPVDLDADGAVTPAELAAGRAAIEAGVVGQMPLSAGGARCILGELNAALRPTFVELTAVFSCPAGRLAQEFRFLSVLPPEYSVVVGRPGEPTQLVADARLPRVMLPEAEAARTGDRGLWQWVRLGLGHIFTGFDHLCFLAALLLVAESWRRVLWLVTSFTLAHSVTLAAAALGWVVLSPGAQAGVEIAIAASIVYVAAENLGLDFGRLIARRRSALAAAGASSAAPAPATAAPLAGVGPLAASAARGGRGFSHRPAVTFGFGLVHGLGFASVLAGYGLEQSVALGLFGFNLGVELGQLAVVLAVFPLLRLASRSAALSARVAQLGSACALVAGCWWLAQRL